MQMTLNLFNVYIIPCNILFSAQSSLRNCLDTQLLRRHNLIVPEDFSSEEVTPSKAPKGQFPGKHHLEHKYFIGIPLVKEENLE